MHLPSVSSNRPLCRLAFFTGIAALSALAVACGDDDDDTKPDAGVEGGSGGKAGSGGKEGCGGSKGGCGGMSAGSGGGGTGGISGNGGVGGHTEEDAGVVEDDAGQDPEPNPDDFRNVRIEMSGLSDEIGEFMQFRLIAEDGELLTIGIIHGVPGAAFDFELPHSAPAGEEVTVEVWADTAGIVDNAYDAAMDHAWTATIPADDADEDAVVEFEHGTQTPPPTLIQGDAAGSLAYTMMDTNDHAGDRFELRVIDNSTGRLVGRQLLEVPGSTTALEVYGVISTGVEYQVDYSIDLDGDDTYDAPPTDAAWRTLVTGTATGYNSGPGATISLSAPPSDDDYVDVDF